MDKNKDHVIGVYDFGGGTFDISILEVGDNVVEVKATNGDTHLGGDNLDQRVIDWLVAEFKKEQGIEELDDVSALSQMKIGEINDINRLLKNRSKYFKTLFIRYMAK